MFFQIALGFADLIIVAIFAWGGVYASLRGGFVVGLFWDIFEVFNGLWLYDWYS